MWSPFKSKPEPLHTYAPIDIRYKKYAVLCGFQDIEAFEGIDLSLYRPGVGVIITNGSSILLLKRSDAGGKWQFVQGGMESVDGVRDSSIITLDREVKEEIGLHWRDYFPIAKLPKALTYDLPKSALKVRKYADHGYIGQAHIYYLVKWTGDLSKLNFSDAEEFCDAMWVNWSLNDIVPHISNIKADPYCRALIYFKDYLNANR